MLRLAFKKNDWFVWFCVDFSILNGRSERSLLLRVKYHCWLFTNVSILHCVVIVTSLTCSVYPFRAVMTDGESIGPTRLVLEPASLAVYLARNLSPWYHDIPDIDVVGKLHAVKVSSV